MQLDPAHGGDDEHQEEEEEEWDRGEEADLSRQRPGLQLLRHDHGNLIAG